MIQRTINSLVLASIHAVGRLGGIELTVRDARRFEIEELSQATKHFSDKNLIGEGKFGEVYRGLLHDGMLVAIKKRHGFPSQEFVDEVIFNLIMLQKTKLHEVLINIQPRHCKLPER